MVTFFRLKADVECDELNIADLFKISTRKEPLKKGEHKYDKKVIYREQVRESVNFNETLHKDVIFKVYTFKKPVTFIKSTARHLLAYSLNKFFGIRRFIGEQNTTFFYKQII